MNKEIKLTDKMLEASAKSAEDPRWLKEENNCVLQWQTWCGCG